MKAVTSARRSHEYRSAKTIKRDLTEPVFVSPLPGFTSACDVSRTKVVLSILPVACLSYLLDAVLFICVFLLFHCFRVFYILLHESLLDSSFLVLVLTFTYLIFETFSFSFYPDILS